MIRQGISNLLIKSLAPVRPGQGFFAPMGITATIAVIPGFKKPGYFMAESISWMKGAHNFDEMRAVDMSVNHRSVD